MITGLDHIQLAMPRGEEDAARAFYIDVLAMAEEPKPPALAGRGGLWLRAGQASVHLGVEDGFRPAQKAHPAFAVASIEAARATLEAAAAPVIDDAPPPGVKRCFTRDPFGNRIELVERLND